MTVLSLLLPGAISSSPRLGRRSRARGLDEFTGPRAFDLIGFVPPRLWTRATERERDGHGEGPRPCSFASARLLIEFAVTFELLPTNKGREKRRHWHRESGNEKIEKKFVVVLFSEDASLNCACMCTSAHPTKRSSMHLMSTIARRTLH